MSVPAGWSFGGAKAKAGCVELEAVTPAENIPGCFDWIHGLPAVDRLILFSDNRARMKQLFGKQSVTFVGEFRYLNWMFDNGFTIAAAARKGTRIEVPPFATLPETQKFILELISLLRPLAQETVLAMTRKDGAPP